MEARIRIRLIMQIFSSKALREFGLLIGLCFPLIIGWLLPIMWGHGFNYWSLWIGITLITLALIKPMLLKWPYIFWMKIGEFLGFINSNIILGLVFIFILQPISIIMKLFKHDPLRKKFNSKFSYRENKIDNKIDFTKIF